MTQLIITEKPQASLRIAEALAEGEILKKLYKSIPYYEITHKNKKILIGCAVGHLYNLIEKVKNGWTYPVFELKWVPSFEISKASAFTKSYVEALQYLSKQADDFIIACDFDTEGSLIGYNVLRFLCNKTDAKRMKFSTLTKEELIGSYEKAQKHLDFPQIEAGETRHFLDHMYGVNTSRALTLAVKSAGYFKILSSGRVQSPILYLLTKREEEIQKFKPEPFWQVFATIDAKQDILAIHKKGNFTKKQEADRIIKKCKNKDATVKKLITKKYSIAPFPAFNITSLQTEAYRLFKYSPKQTLQIAQELYLQAYISYPRTSSEILDPRINYKKILNSLKEFSDLTKGINSLNPVQGKKTDPAHISIYPTNNPPVLSKLTDQQKRIYQLIVRRFIAAFYAPAQRESISAEFDINKETFLANGARTIKKGWAEIYPIKFRENILPELKKDKSYKVKKLELKEDQTKPPSRYTQGSIIAEMEKRNLGTKATRHAILQILYDRYYIEERSIKVTMLGMAVAETLEKYVPELTSEDLTKHFEQELEQVLEKKKKSQKILDEAKKILVKVLDKFRKKEKEIGSELLEAARETKKQMSIVGKCPNCKEGNLVIRKGRFGQFLACDRYPKCKTTQSLPKGLIKPTGKECKFCGKPVILVIREGKRPFEMCLTYNCKSKAGWKKQESEKPKESQAV